MNRLRAVVPAVTLLLAALALPTQASGPGGIVASNDGRPVSAAAQAKALAYWTPARMQAAREPVAVSPARSAPVNGLSDQVGRHPTLVPGSVPGDQSIPSADPTPTDYSYPFPFTSYAVEKELSRLVPYRAIGKIFFTSGGSNYVCSGASVVGGTYQVVYTAGHCINLEGIWSRKVVFVPAYRSGVRPYGSFAARMMYTMTAWYASNDPSYDFAAFDVGKNAAGKTLRSQVGKLGFAYNLTRDVHWNVFGYPAANPFTGEVLWVCQASHATDDLTTGGGGGPQTMGIGCDMTGGSSGGPWIFRFKKGSYLNGVVSYGYDVQPSAMYGPYLGIDANAIRCYAGTNGVSTSC